MNALRSPRAAAAITGSLLGALILLVRRVIRALRRLLSGHWTEISEPGATP